MASFLITFSSNTAQTLIDGETGVIGTSGTLVVSGPQAIGVVDDTRLAVYGTLTSLDGDAVGGPAAGVFDMVVGATGQLVSLGDAVIDVSASISADLRNNGLISGTGAGVIMNTADTGATIRLTNTGTIESMGSAVIIGAGAGSVRIVNAGTILSGNSPSFNGISASGQSVVLQQSGEVIGTVRLNGTVGATLVNRGAIDGDVIMGLGTTNDTFRNVGGTVTGTVFGGLGDDVYFIDRGDLSLSDSGGNDTVNASASYQMASGFEVLNLIGSADINGGGNSGFNTITGNGGNNVLRGFVGNDSLNGGNGDDTLQGGTGNDTLTTSEGDDVLLGGTGRDTLQILSAGNTFVNLSTRVASVDGQAYVIDTFEVVEGSLGNDTMVGSASGSELLGRNGFDILTGGAGLDILDGGSLNDRLTGEGSSDTLIGGTGIDTMTGGTGADEFVYQSLSDSTALAADIILDFDGAGDKINLSAIDANGATAGDGAFLFAGSNFLAVGIASIRAFVSGGDTIIEIRDKDGAGVDMKIVLDGLPTLTAADFVL
jgi:Ca2+-binding RTX toxin-like protein